MCLFYFLISLLDLAYAPPGDRLLRPMNLRDTYDADRGALCAFNVNFQEDSILLCK